MSAVAPEAPIDEQVNLSDLDEILDDDKLHAFCSRCRGSWPKYGDLVETICGRTVLWHKGNTAPCEPCVRARDTQVCPVCGPL